MQCQRCLNADGCKFPDGVFQISSVIYFGKNFDPISLDGIRLQFFPQTIKQKVSPLNNHSQSLVRSLAPTEGSVSNSPKNLLRVFQSSYTPECVF